MEEKLQEFKQDFKELLDSSFLKLEDISKLKKVSGVYFAYYGDEIIYIGSTRNFSVRFSRNFKYKSNHTLHNKLLRELKEPNEVLDFLKNRCRYKIKTCEDKLKAEALEHFAIWIIKPKYNKGIYNAKIRNL